MATFLNRALSLTVAGLYLWLARSGGSGILLKMAVSLILPFACIWFGDTLGSFVGFWGNKTSTSDPRAFWLPSWDGSF